MRALLVTTIALATAGCLGSSLTGGDDGGTGGPNNSAGSGGKGDGAGGTGGNGTGGTGGASQPSAADKFVSDVQPILTTACKACHGTVQTGGIGPTFMFPNPDVLTAVLAYPSLIASTPEGSLLLLKGNHEGPAFTPDQTTVIHDWIVLYNQTKASGGGTGGSGGSAPVPSVKPFAPSMTAMNTIDLSQYNSKFAGMKITFTAKPIGNPQTSIQLSNITVAPTATIGVHIVHPIFNIWDAAGKVETPDPADSFSNLDQTVYLNTTAPLGPGTLVLANFKADSLLNVDFAVLETKGGSGTTTLACKAVANFVANVKPFFSGGNNCSTQCHTGAAPTAGVAWDATPDAQLCLNALQESNTVTPANSRLLMEPNPAMNNGHANKINNFAAFQTALTNWLALEK